jgi:transposase
MKKNVYYVGLDAHKETVSVAWTKGNTRKKPDYFGQCGGSNLAVRNKLKKLSEELGVNIKALKVCYEAGPTGFTLARDLNSAGIECVLCAPSKSNRKPGERIKTDKRDAIKIAKEFRNGDITQVRIPPVQDEAVRDVSRCRTDAVDDHKR